MAVLSIRKDHPEVKMIVFSMVGVCGYLVDHMMSCDPVSSGLNLWS